MRREFTYQPKMVAKNAFFSLAFGAAMIVFPIMYPFTIRGLNIAPIWITLFLGIIGVIMIFGGIKRLGREKKLAAVGKPIVIEDGKLQFVTIVKGRPEDTTVVLADIIRRKHDESDGTYTIFTENESHEFLQSYFDNLREFEDFIRTVRKEVEKDSE